MFIAILGAFAVKWISDRKSIVGSLVFNIWNYFVSSSFVAPGK